MFTPDEFYIASSTNANPLYVDFGFDAELVQVINDGAGKIKIASHNRVLGANSPEIYPGEVLTIQKISGQRLGLWLGYGSDSTASAFRVYAFR